MDEFFSPSYPPFLMFSFAPPGFQSLTWWHHASLHSFRNDGRKVKAVGFASQLSLLVVALEMSFEAQFLEDFVSGLEGFSVCLVFPRRLICYCFLRARNAVIILMFCSLSIDPQDFFKIFFFLFFLLFFFNFFFLQFWQ